MKYGIYGALVCLLCLSACSSLPSGSRGSEGGLSIPASQFEKDEAWVSYGVYQTSKAYQPDLLFVLIFNNPSLYTTNHVSDFDFHNSLPVFMGSSTKLADLDSEVSLKFKNRKGTGNFNLHMDIAMNEEESSMTVEKILVNDKELNYSEGAVFLVDLVDGAASYKQLNVELPRIKRAVTLSAEVKQKKEFMKQLKADSPVIREFIETGRIPGA